VATSVAFIIVALALTLPSSLDPNGDGVVSLEEHLQTIAQLLDADRDASVSIAEFVVRLAWSLVICCVACRVC